MTTQVERISKFEFRGIISDMHQRKEGSTQCDQPHTKFTFITKLIEQKEFEKIMEKIALGGHYAEIQIVTKTLEDKEKCTCGHDESKHNQYCACMEGGCQCGWET